MNKVILSGRLTRDAEISYMQNEKQTEVARFTLAVDRRFKRDGQQNADFIQCSAFGSQANFVEKYTSKGTKINVVGRWETGSFTNKDGQRIYTNTCMIEDVEFGESKNASQQPAPDQPERSHSKQAFDEDTDGFMKADDGLADDDVPFK